MGTIRHISVSIDGTSPKLPWQIALVILYTPTRVWVQTPQGAWFTSKRNPKLSKARIGVLTPAGAAGAAFAISRMSRGSPIRGFMK